MDISESCNGESKKPIINIEIQYFNIYEDIIHKVEFNLLADTFNVLMFYLNFWIILSVFFEDVF